MYNCRLLDMDRNDLFEYTALHKAIFPGSMYNISTITWYYKYLFASEVRTYGMFDDNKLIGMWSVEPRTFDHMEVGRAFATAIHSDYRRQGLFVELSKFAIQSERERKQYQYILGFPQVNRIVTDGHLKSGWYFVQKIAAHILQNIDIVRDSIENAPSYMPMVSFYDMKRVNLYAGTFFDSIEFLDKKWLYHPSRSYNVIKLKDEYGFAVLKIYGSICHILDIDGNFQNILQVVKQLCKYHNWTAITTWCAENDQNYIAAIKSEAFEETDKIIPSVTLLAVNITNNTPLSLSTTHLQMGVEESY